MDVLVRVPLQGVEVSGVHLCLRKQTFSWIVTLLPFPCQNDLVNIHTLNVNCKQSFPVVFMYKVFVVQLSICCLFSQSFEMSVIVYQCLVVPLTSMYQLLLNVLLQQCNTSQFILYWSCYLATALGSICRICLKMSLEYI